VIEPDVVAAPMITDDTPKAGRREWFGLAIPALPCLLITMDLTVLYLAVPELSADLGPSSTQLLWITDIYGFLIAGSLLTMGSLGDRIGRRRLLLMGATGFAAASVLAAFSTSAAMLIAARALLGVAGATLMPSTLSLIRAMFHDPQQRTIAIGVWGASLSAGAVIGPLAGGALLEFFWWGSVFLLGVPVMALLLALGPRVLPEYRDPKPGRFDLPSAVLSLVAVLAVVYGLKRIAEGGAAWPAALSIAAGFSIGVVFVLRQRVLADPLIELRLFRAPAFSVSLAATTLALFAIIGMDLFVAQYLQLVLGMGPFEAGLWLLPSAGGILVGAMLAPLLGRRVRARFAVVGGLALGALGSGLLTQVEESSLALLVAGSVVMGLGLGAVGTLGTDLIVGAAPPARAGAAAGISETGTELGGALGIAILGSVGVAVYRSEVGDAVPSGLPPETAAAARDTLGGAVGAADRLPAGLLETAGDAFVQGLQLAALTSAAVVAGMAVLAALLLRGQATH
jgi:MFS transporter, DHA2 family, multidrug resistance protein